MTDYPRRKDSQRLSLKWQSYTAIFVTIVLFFALISGIGKSISFGRVLGDSTWDSQSSVSFAVNSKVPSILIYQTYPRNLVFVNLDGEASFVTGSSDTPVMTIKSVFESSSGSDLSHSASKIVHAPITNFITYKNEFAADLSFDSEFKKFASIATPFKILIKGTGDPAKTDFSRADLIKLWWQVKSMDVNELKTVDTKSLHEEIVLSGGQKVLGVDDVSLSNLLSKYLENRKILEENKKVLIINSTGVPSAGKLAGDFVKSIGASVDGIERGGGEREKTYVIAKKSYTANYLAKLFDCDITSEPNADEDTIKVVLGRDFAQKYALIN